MMDIPEITPAMRARERLYAVLCSSVLDVDDDVTESRLNAYLDRHIRQSPHLAALAERAGGRWHVIRGQMEFVPW